MIAALKSVRVVFGIQHPIKPISNHTHGRIRIRMRRDKAASAYVKTSDDITEYRLKDNGDTWELYPEGGIARNWKHKHNFNA